MKEMKDRTPVLVLQQRVERPFVIKEQLDGHLTITDMQSRPSVERMYDWSMHLDSCIRDMKASPTVVLPIDLSDFDERELREKINTLNTRLERRFEDAEKIKIIIAGINGTSGDENTTDNVQAIKREIFAQRSNGYNYYFDEFHSLTFDGPEQVYRQVQELIKPEPIATLETAAQKPKITDPKSEKKGIFSKRVISKPKAPEQKPQEPKKVIREVQSWAKQTTVAVITGLEPFLQQLEKSGNSILTFGSGFGITKVIESSTIAGKTQIMQAQMESGGILTVKVDPDAGAEEGRKVRIEMLHAKDLSTQTLRETTDVVKDLMERCTDARVLRRIEGADGVEIRANPLKNISIDTSECKLAAKVVIDRALKEAGFAEQLNVNKEPQQHRSFDSK
ncbi:MAG: hypothetical protein M3R00_02365 [Pseudomonadota bacterium]|nr:hypothetical protein [Pseudomonadota bacterium]